MQNENTSECPVCMTPIGQGAERCPVCGFKFQGATCEFAPIPAEGAEEDFGQAEVDGGAEACLRVVRGPKVGLAYELGAGESTIGRNPSCDIFLNDMTVSRSHAKIESLGGAHVISDQQSYNGVWVNNESIDSKALSDGDFVQIGKFGFIYDAK